MRPSTKRTAQILAVIVAGATLLATIPILHPLRFFWGEGGECDLVIQGFCPARGGPHGIHSEMIALEGVRMRISSVRVGPLAWEAVFTRRLPTNGSNQAMQRTAR
jgi:hypothetical protein